MACDACDLNGGAPSGAPAGAAGSSWFDAPLPDIAPAALLSPVPAAPGPSGELHEWARELFFSLVVALTVALIVRRAS